MRSSYKFAEYELGEDVFKIYTENEYVFYMVDGKFMVTKNASSCTRSFVGTIDDVKRFLMENDKSKKKKRQKKNKKEA